ncbi:MAG: nitroreductase family protein [Erysipelotrichaceae bacterium]|nr:nitroreductase family protein [Erysipelotrichaceae bacterium]
MNDILDVIDTRSSIRKYEDKMIPADVCRKLVEAGLKAPTATNKQEIHITVVTKDNPVQKEIQNDMNPDAEVNFYYDAPVTLYLSALESFKWSAVDAGIAVENIHLAAAGMGLGSVILGCMETTLNGEKKEEYARKLAFPEGYKYYVAIAVGYPATEKVQHNIDFERDVTVL